MSKPLGVWPVVWAVRDLTERHNGWPPNQRELAEELGVGLETVNRWAHRAVRLGLLERGGARGAQLRVRSDR